MPVLATMLTNPGASTAWRQPVSPLVGDTRADGRFGGRPSGPALLYAVLLLFQQRQAEFRMLRSLGATRMLLAVDLSVLFAAPLTLAFGLAVASGAALATSYNTAFGVSAPQVDPQAISVLAVVLAIGVAATALVAARAIRIPPLVADPDAATG